MRPKEGQIPHLPPVGPQGNWARGRIQGQRGGQTREFLPGDTWRGQVGCSQNTQRTAAGRWLCAMARLRDVTLQPCPKWEFVLQTSRSCSTMVQCREMAGQLAFW